MSRHKLYFQGGFDNPYLYSTLRQAFFVHIALSYEANVAIYKEPLMCALHLLLQHAYTTSQKRIPKHGTRCYNTIPE